MSENLQELSCEMWFFPPKFQREPLDVQIPKLEGQDFLTQILQPPTQKNKKSDIKQEKNFTHMYVYINIYIYLGADSETFAILSTSFFYLNFPAPNCFVSRDSSGATALFTLGRA